MGQRCYRVRAAGGDQVKARVIAVAAPGEVPLVNHPDVTVYENTEGRSMADIGNEFLDGCDVFGLCHADVGFGPGALSSFVASAATGLVCGIVGTSYDGEYVWCHGVDKPVDVTILDACSVFFRPDSGLRFDATTFDGFHLYTEDLCLQARYHGFGVQVIPGDAGHQGSSTPKAGWLRDYCKYAKRLQTKWPDEHYHLC